MSNVACSSRRCSSRPSWPITFSRSPWSQEPGLLRRPGRQPGELLRRRGQRRRQLPVQRGLAPVLPDLPHRHREPHRHRRASACLPGMIPAQHPGNGPGTRGTRERERHPGRVPGTLPLIALNSMNHYR